MPIEGVDYSWSRPDPTRLAAAGKKFACRYLSYTASKNLTAAEARRLHAAGVATVANWEATADGWRGGGKAGAQHAIEAKRLAAELGIPADRPIYFSIDTDTSNADLSGPVAEYLAAAAAVLGAARVGVYGGIRTVRYALDHGLARWAWQTYAWSGGQWDSRAHIQQYRNGVTLAGADVDLNRATVLDYGQWGVEDVVTPAEVRAIAEASAAATVKALMGYVVEKTATGTAPDRTIEKMLRDDYLRIDKLANGTPAQLVLDAEALRPVLLDPLVLEAQGKATAGEIAGLRFEAETDTP